MDPSPFQIEHWVARNRFTAGRRGFALLLMQQALARAGHDDLAALCGVLYAAELLHLERHTSFKAAQAAMTTATWTPEIIAADVDLDRLLSELREVLQALAKRDTPRGRAAKALLEAGFKQGVAWYIQAPIGEEEVRVAGLLAILGRYPDEVALATVEDVVADVTTAHAHYRELIYQHVKAEPESWDALKASDLANQRAFLELIAQVLGRTSTQPEAERLAARAEILRGVEEQNEAISEAVRNRRRVKDVHPETGSPEA